MSRKHERYEILLMKASDGVIADDERRDLEAHLSECARCRDELEDFRRIIGVTDSMRARILADVEIEPPRESRPTRLALGLSFVLLLIGALILVAFAGYGFLSDAKIPLLVKVGAAVAAVGALGLLAYVFRIRLRAHRRDPYREIDQ